MANKIEVKENDNGEQHLDLEEILKGTNVNLEDVEFYKILKEGDAIILVLFDKDKKQIKVGAEGE